MLAFEYPRYWHLLQMYQWPGHFDSPLKYGLLTIYAQMVPWRY